MRYIRLFSFILVPILVMSLACTTVRADEDTTVAYRGIDAQATYLGDREIVVGETNLSDNVGSALLYELNSDTMMYAYNADEKTSPSSLAKIMTALIAIKEGNLNDVVTVKESVLNTVPYNAASAGLVAGEEISLSDLIYCMMVGSANDAAAVIAVHVGSSQAAFVQKMNYYAQTFGCKNTHFTNVHGLHDERQYTTARDMGRILSEAVKLDTFLKYFNAVRYTVPATNKSPNGRVLTTSNYLMNNDTLVEYFDSRVIGGRTGTTQDGLRCLASLAEKGSMRFLCVVMGAISTYDEDGNTQTYGSFKETSALLNAGFSGYKVAQILYTNQALMQKDVDKASNDVVLGVSSSVYALLPEDVTISDLSYKYIDAASVPTAPIELGQVLSAVQVWYGGTCVAQADLVALNAVPEYIQPKQPQQNITEKEDDSKTVLIVGSVIIGAIVVIFAVLFLKRIMKALLVKRSNQYRRNRRRGHR